MDSLIFQTKTSDINSKQFFDTDQDFFVGHGGIELPSGVLPAEEIDIQGLLSQYRTSVDLEIQYLKNQITSLTGEIMFQSQIIRELQERKIVPVQNLRSSKLHLKEPLYISVECSNGIFVAFSDDLNLYGQGETELNAIRDFCKEIENLYFDLKKSKNKLGKVMKENWQFFKNITKET